MSTQIHKEKKRKRKSKEKKSKKEKRKKKKEKQPRSASVGKGEEKEVQRGKRGKTNLKKGRKIDKSPDYWYDTITNKKEV